MDQILHNIEESRLARATECFRMGKYNEAIFNIQEVLSKEWRDSAALKLLKQVRTQSAINRECEGKKLILNKCLAYDSSFEDKRILVAIGQFLDVKGKSLALYGAGQLCQYIFDQMPHLNRSVACIIDDDPSKQGKSIQGIPIVSLEQIPSSVEDVLVCSTKVMTMFRIQKRLSTSKQYIRMYTLSLIQQLDSGAIPERAWAKPKQHIYPIEIPPIQFRKNQDFILLELPPRQIPMMPYGVGYVNNILKKAGIDVQTVDLNIILYHRYYSRTILDGEDPGPWNGISPWEGTNFEPWTTEEALEYFKKDIDEVVQKLIAAHPKVLGISLHHPVRLFADKIVAGFKEHCPDTMVVVGGYDCIRKEVAPNKFDKYDYMVLGEAELTLPPLAKELVIGNRPKDMPGVISIFDSPDREFRPGDLPTDLDSVDFPKYEWFDDISIYRTFWGGVAVPFSISRGCAWSRCNFCGERFCFRTRSPEKVVDELQWFFKQGLWNFVSMESDVNGNPENMKSICREIIRREMKLALYGQLRIDRRNDLEFFKLLRKAGFHTVVFGVDAWTDHALILQRKGYNMKIVEQNLRYCHEAELTVNTNMVIGVPGETEEDIDQAIENITRLKEYINSFTTINMMRLIPGSRYYQEPEKYKIRFRGKKDEIYKIDPNIISERLWYSEEPYIDEKVRVSRYKRLCRGLLNGGVELGDFAKWENAREIKKMNDTNISSGTFEEAVSA